MLRVILTTALAALATACGGSVELAGYEQREAWISGDVSTSGDLHWTDGSGLEPGASAVGNLDAGSKGELVIDTGGAQIVIPIELSTHVHADDEGGALLTVCHTVALFSGCTDVPLASPTETDGDDHEPEPAPPGSDEATPQK